jgi:hypothetical protein
MSTNHAILRRAFAGAALAALALTSYACGGKAEQAGQPCAQASDCYPGIDPTKIQGTVMCLDKVPGGYCTHLCQTDADCCAAQGECPGGHPEVCAPFESTGMMMCFLSCEASDLGSLDETTYCQDYAGSAFSCRSTGGGAKNRKICSP